MIKNALKTFVILFFIFGCRAKNNSSFKLNADFLELKGNVINPSGAKAANVNVFMQLDKQVKTTTNNKGEFSLLLNTTDLKKTQDTIYDVNPSQNGYKIFFHDKNNKKLQAQSKLIEFSKRGSIKLGKITLRPTIKLKGNVKQISNGSIQPSSGTTITAVNNYTKSDSKGNFILDVVDGDINLYALNGDKKAARKFTFSKQQALSLAGVAEYNLDRPMVLIDRKTSSGWVYPNKISNNKGLFSRQFSVDRSTNIKYMRYSDNKFENNSPLQWQPVTNDFNYNFSNKSTVLYVQFADESQTKYTNVQTIDVIEDIFEETENPIILDVKEGVVTQRFLTLRTQKPYYATKVRIHTNKTTLLQQPWQVALNEINYMIPKNTFIDSINGGQFTIFMQFSDDYSHTSDIITATSVYKPFHFVNNPAFTIEDGVESVSHHDVFIDLDLPDNAWKMRFFENEDNFSKEKWISVQNKHVYSFKSPGLKKLYLQYMDVDGLVSPLYYNEIRILPFANQLIEVFILNDDNLISRDSIVNVELIPPTGSSVFRMSDKEEILADLQWRTLEINNTYDFKTSGRKELFIQFKDIDNFKSPVYNKEILIDPFFEDLGTFKLNNDSDITHTTDLTIDINPPDNAVEMIVVDHNDESNNIGWQSVKNVLFWTLTKSGIHNISIKYKSIDNIVSPNVNKSIELILFAPEYLVFDINNDDATTSSTLLQLDLNPPPAANKVKIAENLQDLQSTSALNIISPMFFTVSNVAEMKTIYVQYLTAKGELSPVFSEQIELLP